MPRRHPRPLPDGIYRFPYERRRANRQSGRGDGDRRCEPSLGRQGRSRLLVYRETMFNHHCFNHSNVEEGFFDQITITCNIFSPKAFVEICVADKENDVLTESDDGEVPDCCKPPPTDGSNVVCYNLEINCVSECVDEAQERKRTLLQQAGGWFFDGEQ